jgi:hypothetical protein
MLVKGYFLSILHQKAGAECRMEVLFIKENLIQFAIKWAEIA